MEAIDITKPPLVCLPVFVGFPDMWERIYMHDMQSAETRMLKHWLAQIEPE